MNSRSTPQWKPPEFIPVFKIMIFEMLHNAKEQYSPLLEARRLPHILDDHTVSRILKLYTEQRENLWVYEKQIALWKELELSSLQQHAINTTIEALNSLRQMIDKILNLTEQLQPHTIDQMLSKDDCDLALDFLSKGNFDPAHLETQLPEIEQTIERMIQLENQYQEEIEALRGIFARFVPQVPPLVAEKCGEILGIIPTQLQDLSLRTVFADYCLFHYLQEGKSLIADFMDQYIEELNDEEMMILNSFRKATFTVLKMEAILIEGAMAVYDLLKHERHIMFDEDLVEGAFPGMRVVCHLVKERDFVFTTGTAIVLSPESKAARLIDQLIQRTPEALDTQGKTEYATNGLKIVFGEISR